MSKCRVSVGGEMFIPREWLRREVLWASLMTPYSDQLSGWLNETQIYQHAGNITRQNVYNTEGDSKKLSLSFFNQGKNVGGLITSIALFKSMMNKTGEGAAINLLEVQAVSIDRVLDMVGLPTDDRPDEKETYRECAQIMSEVLKASGEDRFRNRRLLYVKRSMAGLAVAECSSWLDASLQNSEGTLPELTINNGGHPRSGGHRVDKLQPIFHKIIASKPYQKLSIPIVNLSIENP